MADKPISLWARRMARSFEEGRIERERIDVLFDILASSNPNGYLYIEKCITEVASIYHVEGSGWTAGRIIDFFFLSAGIKLADKIKLLAAYVKHETFSAQAYEDVAVILEARTAGEPIEHALDHFNWQEKQWYAANPETLEFNK